MANVPLTNFPAVSTLSPTDIFALVQNNITSKATLSQMFTLNSTFSLARFATNSLLLATYDNGASGIGATLSGDFPYSSLNPDGTVVSVGDRVLVKNQSTTYQNGLYEVTAVGTALVPWVLTRVTDYDEPGDILQGSFFTIADGTVNGLTQWIQTEVVTTVGTDPILFQSNVVAGTGITKTKNTLSLTIPVAMSSGGTGKALIADNGGIVYTDADSMEILAATATAGKTVRSAANAAPSWSTFTIADTYTDGELLYSNGANTVEGLAAANEGSLGTDASGIPAWVAGPAADDRYWRSNNGARPSWSSAAPAHSGANDNITSITAMTGTIDGCTGMRSGTGEYVWEPQFIVSAVNYFEFSNNSTTAAPFIGVKGTDANIDLAFKFKGTGGYLYWGTSSSAAELKLMENTGSGINTIGWKAPATLASNISYTLPAILPAENNTVWRADTSGNFAADLVIANGTYTPTASNLSNIDAVTPFLSYYTRIGNQVIVWGAINIDPTSSAVSSFQIDVPISSSNFTAGSEAAGTCSGSAVTGLLFAINAISGAQKVQFRGVPPSGTNYSYSFMFSYLII